MKIYFWITKKSIEISPNNEPIFELINKPENTIRFKNNCIKAIYERNKKWEFITQTFSKYEIEKIQIFLKKYYFLNKDTNDNYITIYIYQIDKNLYHKFILNTFLKGEI